MQPITGASIRGKCICLPGYISLFGWTGWFAQVILQSGYIICCHSCCICLKLAPQGSKAGSAGPGTIGGSHQGIVGNCFSKFLLLESSTLFWNGAAMLLLSENRLSFLCLDRGGELQKIHLESYGTDPTGHISLKILRKPSDFQSIVFRKFLGL